MRAGGDRADLAAAAAEVTGAGALAERVEAVLSGELYWFPVRHHSPAVARHLEAVIRQRRPRLIFLEGPAQAAELIPYLIHRQTRPPVAIYSSFRLFESHLWHGGKAARAEQFRRQLATFCAAARATSSPEAAVADGTVARERFMLRTVSETLAETGAGDRSPARGVYFNAFTVLALALTLRWFFDRRRPKS